MLLSIIFITIFYIFIIYLILVYKEIYSNYIFTMHSIGVNHPNPMLQHNFNLESNFKYNNKLNVTLVKTSKLVEENKDWLLGTKLSIYQPLMDEVNLDFSSAANFSAINLINSSSIIEKIYLNNVFNNLVVKTTSNTESISNNALSINGNRNSLTLNTFMDLLQNRVRSKELLNYP